MKDTLQDRVFRLEAINEAQRIIGLYSNYMTMGRYSQARELFASGMDDVRAEMLWGVYDGKDSLDRLYNGLFPKLDALKGQDHVELCVQSMEVPVITPAQDCKTVKAVWVSPGFMNIVNSDGKLTAYWSWQKYACDFIFENGAWKIWHLHVYGMFESKYGDNMVWPSGTFGYTGNQLPEDLAPDHCPTTSFSLSPTSTNPYAPAVPKPYTVFDGDLAY